MYRYLITVVCLLTLSAGIADAGVKKNTLTYLEDSKGRYPANDPMQRDRQVSMDSYDTKLPPPVARSKAESAAAPETAPARVSVPPPAVRAGGPQRVAPSLTDTMTTAYVSQSGLAQQGYAQPANPDAEINRTEQYAFRYTEMRNTKTGLYAAAFGGVTPLQNYQDAKINFDQSVPGVGQLPYDTGSNLGAVAGVKVGYQFDPIPLGSDFAVGSPGLRPVVELESMYVRFRSDGNVKAPTTVPPTDLDGEHEMRMANFSVNALMRFELGRWVHPYVGVGVGAAYVWGESEVDVDAPPPATNGKLDGYHEDFVFSTQGIAGLELRINPHWGLFTEYKYLYLPTLQVEDKAYEMDLENVGLHLITGGLRYNF